MALPIHTLFFVTIFLVVARDGVEAQKSITVSTASFASRSTCDTPGVAPTVNGTSTLRLTHRHGPCSPSRASPRTKASFLETLRADQRRAEYIQSRLSGGATPAQQLGSSEAATVPANIGFSIGTLQYVVTVRLGTPAVSQTLEVDTGSDLSWVQCKPCPMPPCYSQKDPLFDPSQSSSYAAVTCSAAACSQLGLYKYGCTGSQCEYVVSYGDGSKTTGVYSYETLTLTTSDVVDNFLFGCGHDDEGLFNGIDGLIGLGRQAQSLVSQTSSVYDGVFSYCLPPSPSSAGFLTLGASGGASGFSTTPLLSASNAPTFYIVMIVGISVGGQQLSVPASVFSGGTVVDSGTVITRLPPTAYAALRSAFRSAMTAYPAAQPTGILDTCYDFSGYGSVTLPRVVLMFSGGTIVEISAPGILSSGCLAFAATNADGNAAILGNVQQRTFEVRFDGSSVGFRPDSC